MSTRSQIKVKGSDIMIYKHSDGYPSGVMPTLKKTVEWFIEERGNEPDYALAQIMRAFARRDERKRKEGLAEHKAMLENFEGEEDSTEYKHLKMWVDMYSKQSPTGWGLDCIRHGDIDYMYIVDLKNGIITIEGRDGVEEVIKVKE